MAPTLRSQFFLLLLATIAAASATQAFADQAFRIVVQDARPSVIAVSGNASAPSIRMARHDLMIDLVLAVDANRRSSHVFYVIDLKTKMLIHAISFPESITGAAIAKSKDWYLVSGEKHLYRVDAKSGEFKVLLENASGKVGISDDEKFIAVLGRLKNDVTARSSIRLDAMKLGIFDLAKQEWVVQTQTPVQISEQIYFDGDRAVGVGIGGRVHSRAASSFPCHIVVDSKSKESKTISGVETGFGRPANDDYVAPTQALVNRSKLQLCRQLIPDAVSNLNPAPGTGAIASFTPLTTSNKSALIHVNRLTNDRWLYAALEITKKGKLVAKESSVGFGQNPVRLGNGIYTKNYLDKDHDQFVDLITGKVSKHPRIDNSVSGKPPTVQVLTRCGSLTFSAGEFQMMDLGGAIRWRRSGFKEYGRLGQIAVSHSGKWFAFTQNENDIQVLNSADGKTKLNITRPANKGQAEFRYTRTLCFSKDESQIAILFDRIIHVYELATGKLLHQVTCEKKQYNQKIFSVDGKWFLSGYRQSRFWEPGKGLGEPIDFPDVTLVQPYSHHENKKLILQNETGKAAILDLQTLELQAHFLLGIKGPRNRDADPIPNLMPFFDDQVLVVPSGRSAQFKLLSTDDLSTIVTVHPIPVDGKLGWITFTEDGHWDASVGAEKYVRVFSNGERQGDYVVQARRKKGLLSARLKKALK